VKALKPHCVSFEPEPKYDAQEQVEKHVKKSGGEEAAVGLPIALQPAEPIRRHASLESRNQLFPFFDWRRKVGIAEAVVSPCACNIPFRTL